MKADLQELNQKFTEKANPEALTKKDLSDALQAELDEFTKILTDLQLKDDKRIEKDVKIQYENKQFTYDTSPQRWWKKLPLEDRVGEFGKDICSKKETIYFLKTSKTGGTTFANILMRFGFAREGTNFLLGENANGGLFFVNGYLPFDENVCFLGRDIPNRPLFDISYVHMRYNRTAVDRVMKKDVFKVSILRDPVSNFISSWKYYHNLTTHMRAKVRADMKEEERGEDDARNANFYGEMDQFLTKPWKYLETYNYDHFEYLFTVNPQFLFFGYPSYLLSIPFNKGFNLVDKWIGEIEKDFDHIIILEDLDRSLAVLMLKLCWSIEDVVHLKLNAMTADSKSISLESEKRLREFNWADNRLYHFFKKKLEKEVEKIGEEKINSIVDRITHAAGLIAEECFKPDMSTGWITSPVLKREKLLNQTCNLMTRDVTGWIQADQIERWKHEYPLWRKPKEEQKESDKIKGKELPDFCNDRDVFGEWMLKQDAEYRAVLHWKTNEHDYRNYVPAYLENFKKPLKPFVNALDNRIFN